MVSPPVNEADAGGAEGLGPVADRPGLALAEPEAERDEAEEEQSYPNLAHGRATRV